MALISNDFRVKHGLTVATTATIQSTTNSTNTQTGALIVAGGAAIAKDLFVAGTINALNSATTALVVKSNINMVSPDSASTITIRMLNSDAISFSGNSGQLFSITDSMTGTIFAVNDISGVPSIEVYDTGEVRLAETFGFVNIPNSTSVNSTLTGALRISGGIGVGGGGVFGGIVTATTFVGNLTGTASLASLATTANNLASGSAGGIPIQVSPGVTAFVPLGTSGQVLTAGTNTATWTAVSGLSAGTAVTATNANNILTVQQLANATYYPTFVDANNATAAYEALYTTSSFNINPSTNAVTFGGTVSAPLFSGPASQVQTTAQSSSATYYPTFVDANNTSAANETVYTTSSFVINPSTGNVGIGTSSPTSRLTVTGSASISSDTVVTGGSLQVRNGIQFYLWNSDTTNYYSLYNTGASGTNTGILSFVQGGVGERLRLNNSGSLIVYATTNATSTITGAFQVVGGAGIGGNLYIGGDSNIAGNEVVTGTLRINSGNSNTGTNTLNALYTAGGAWIDKTLVVGGDTTFRGNVIFQGTNTFVYSSSTVYTDNIVSLHAPAGSTPGNHTWTVDDGRDVGLLFHYYKGADLDAFLGMDNATQDLEWYSNGTESGGVFTGTTYGRFRTGSIRLLGGAANASNTSTGDLTVLGGVGIGGGLFVGGTVTATNFVGAFSGTVTGAATQINTVAQTANATYYPTFVDTNNSGALGESVFTTSSFAINPSTGFVSIGNNSTGNAPLNVFSQAALGGTAGNYIPIVTQQATGGFGGNNVYDTSWRLRASAGTDWLTQKIHNGISVDASFGVPGSTTKTWWERYPNAGTQAWGNGATTFLFLDSAGKLLVGATASTSGATGIVQIRGNLSLTSASAVDGGFQQIDFAAGIYTKAAIRGISRGTIDAADLSFLTAPNGDLIQERMRISSTGVVTINATTVSTNTGTGALVVNGGVGINGALNAITKSFNIGHPTKPGMTLRYGSLEGPEFGVYVRGRLTGGNTIELPEYWTKLVDPDTITVNLTPVGSHQKLYVEDIVNNTVIVGNENIFGKAVDCFYTVWAERADIDKLQVESE